MARQIHVEMIPVVVVVIGTEDGGETLTGPLVDGTQELALRGGAVPAALYADGSAIREVEGGDVEGVSVSVLGQSCPWHIVLRTATVGRGYLQANHIGTEIMACGRHD